MSTSYRVCLSVLDEQCPIIEENCQACEQITTLEYYPYGITNLKFVELKTQIKITWLAPSLPSGNITSYNVFLKGNCKTWDTVNCGKINVNCEIFENKAVLKKEFLFDFNSYWEYEVLVSAVNSIGSRNNVSAKYTTQKKKKSRKWIYILLAKLFW